MDIVTVKITNDYSDGHHSESEELIEYNGEPVEDWFEERVYGYTGDGHGIDSSLGSCYTAEVLSSHVPELIGETYEWTD